LLTVAEEGAQAGHRSLAIGDVGSVAGPGPKPVAVAGGDSQQLADHQHWQRHRNRLDEVAGSIPGSHVVEELAGQLLDPRSQCPHPSRAEMRL